MEIAKQDAQKILDADLANIVRKVKSGKTLTARERTVIEAASGDNEPTASYTTNKSELARVLGVTRQRMNGWCKISNFPRADSAGRYEIGSCMAWMREHGKSDVATSTPELDYYAAKLRERAAIAEIRELELDKLKGTVVLAADVDECWGNIVVSIRQIIKGSRLSDSEKQHILKELRTAIFAASPLAQTGQQQDT